MIQVLLLILKIFGIMFLTLLGLILLLFLLVLFVPFFYRVRVIHNPEKTKVKIRASFLFPFLLVTVQYLKKISYNLRIFGFAFLDSEKPKKEKKKVKPKKKQKNKSKKITVAETIQVESPVQESKVETESEEKEGKPEDFDPEAETVPEQTGFSSETKEEKQGFFEKIKCKIQKIRETISNVIAKIKKLLHQKDEVQRILAKPETKQVLRYVWEKLKRLLKHILPRKIKGYVAYGADNPATTGQVLGILSVVYAKTGKLLEIRPNFVEKQLECDVELTGRVQVFTLLVIVVKVFLNKELRKLVSELKGLKEIE